MICTVIIIFFIITYNHSVLPSIDDTCYVYNALTCINPSVAEWLSNRSLVRVVPGSNTSWISGQQNWDWSHPQAIWANIILLEHALRRLVLSSVLNTDGRLQTVTGLLSVPLTRSRYWHVRARRYFDSTRLLSFVDVDELEVASEFKLIYRDDFHYVLRSESTLPSLLDIWA